MNEFEQSKQAAKIKVVGVGGAGCNAINTMIASRARAAWTSSRSTPTCRRWRPTWRRSACRSARS